MKNQAPLTLLGILVVVFCLLPDRVYGHKVNVFGYAEDGKVYVEGYFADGSRASNSLVEVFDAQTGERLLEGRTDDKGTFSFKIPRITALRLVITASMGHRNEYTLSRQEVAEAMGLKESGARNQKAEGQSREVEGLKTVQEGKMPSGQGSTGNTAEIERVVERVIERRLIPVKNMLLKIQEETSRPGITEVLGGIGYIIGLIGIALYFKSRKGK